MYEAQELQNNTFEDATRPLEVKRAPLGLAEMMCTPQKVSYVTSHASAHGGGSGVAVDQGAALA
jgi:hypothetical protein